MLVQFPLPCARCCVDVDVDTDVVWPLRRTKIHGTGNEIRASEGTGRNSEWREASGKILRDSVRKAPSREVTV